MKFKELLRKVLAGECGVTADSRKVQQGDVFVAVPGVQADGTQYIPMAAANGAAVVVCREKCAAGDAVSTMGVTVILHPDPRQALWQLAAALHGTMRYADEGMKILAITGTNGKTTCAYLLEHLFTQLGYKVGVMGTVSYRWPGHVEEAPLTTPDPLRVHGLLAAMKEAGVDVVVMEASSHALDQGRVGGVPFTGALFTNLTQDHLDFHHNMEGYFEAKARLFTELPLAEKVCAINASAKWGRRLLDMCPGALSYGLPGEGGKPTLAGEILATSTAGLLLHMNYGEEEWELHSPLVGAFNAANLLGVQALALGMGVAPADLRHLESFRGVCGRLERVVNDKRRDVFVDYAHTPDALVNVLQALRGAGFKRIITVFGCGGNRDRTKRPLMGQAVALWSDVAVLTSDNPRLEDPQEIIADVLPGLRGEEVNDQGRPVEIHIHANRRTATQVALELAGEGDAVLIAGKGHEDYQIINGVKHPYSDQATVRELLQCV